MSLENFTDSDAVYVGGSYSTSGIQNASLAQNGTDVVLFIGFRNPFETAPGMYTDSITVRACLESPCINHIAGSPQTISVFYTVAAPPIPPRMTLQHNAIELDGFILDTVQPPIQTIDVAFANMGANTTPFVSVAGTSNAISIVGYSQFGATPDPQGRISIFLKPPALLGVGDFTDEVTVRGCLDSNCVNEVQGSPASIDVHFNVSDTLPGPNGFTAKAIQAQANDLVWDELRQVFYVSVMSSASANANTIGVLDPVSGNVSTYAPVGNDPGDMVLSADGQYLYVALRGTGSIQRLLLPALVPDLTIPMGARSPDSAPLYAKEMHVSPDASRTIAVVRSAAAVASGSEYDLVVFDDDVMRPQTVGGGAPERVSTFQWETGARIFGVNSSNSDGNAFQIAVAPDGLSVTASQQSVTSFDGRAYLVAGRMLMQRGRVFDPVTFGQLGQFPLGLPFGTVLTPDESIGKAFFLLQGSIQSFDLDSLAPLASIALPGAAPTFVSRQVRWGPYGLALLNYLNGVQGILLINGPFVQP